MIIDAHVHITGFADSLLVCPKPKKNLKVLLAEMKKAGVDHSIIIPGFRRGRDITPDTATLLKLVRGVDAVSAMSSIDVLNYSPADLDELERWVRTHAVVAVKLYLGYQHFYPTNERCRPIYEMCSRHGVPVVFHAGDTLSTTSLQTRVKYAHPLAIDDVAVDHPQLKIVIAHVGNPWTVDCAEVLYRHETVFADLSGLCGESVAFGPTNPNYIDLLRRRIGDLVAYASPRKLLFGTDWALTRHGYYLDFVRSLNLGTDEDREFVMWRNAAEIFNLPESRLP